MIQSEAHHRGRQLALLQCRRSGVSQLLPWNMSTEYVQKCHLKNRKYEKNKKKQATVSLSIKATSIWGHS